MKTRPHRKVHSCYSRTGFRRGSPGTRITCESDSCGRTIRSQSHRAPWDNQEPVAPGTMSARDPHPRAAPYSVCAAMPIQSRTIRLGWCCKLCSERACTARPALAQGGAAQESRGAAASSPEPSHRIDTLLRIRKTNTLAPSSTIRLQLACFKRLAAVWRASPRDCEISPSQSLLPRGLVDALGQVRVHCLVRAVGAGDEARGGRGLGSKRHRSLQRHLRRHRHRHRHRDSRTRGRRHHHGRTLGRPHHHGRRHHHGRALGRPHHRLRHVHGLSLHCVVCERLVALRLYTIVTPEPSGERVLAWPAVLPWSYRT